MYKTQTETPPTAVTSRPTSNMSVLESTEGALTKAWKPIRAILGILFMDYDYPLKAESGQITNTDCNPCEYDMKGQKVARDASELGIITEFEERLSEVLKDTMSRREELTELRQKFDPSVGDGFPHYDETKIRILMAAFSILDENDDLLIDQQEFVNALVHFKGTADRGTEHDLFELADRANSGVIDFEEFVHLCSIVEGHIKTDSSNQRKIKDSIFAKFLDSHIQSHNIGR